MSTLLIDRFLEQSERHAERIAIIHNERKITYAALAQRARALAAYLHEEFHPAHEQLVGIHGTRSIDSITGMLAVMLAGGAYVPLPANWPEGRKRAIIEDAKISVVLEDEFAVPLDSTSWRTILIRTAISETHVSGRQLPERSVNQLAYVMFTSGSTGKPKGVMIEQRNVMAMLNGFEKIAPAGPELSGSALVSIGFDVSVWEIYAMLCFGGTLHLIDHPEMMPELARYIASQSIKSAYLPPLLLADFIREIEKAETQPVLERLLVGVEPIQQKTLQRLTNILPGLKIINGYGPTETTICATFYEFKRAIEAERRTPIGKAVDGYRVYLIDEELEPVKKGDEGEILICGAGVGRGYLADTTLTDEKFINDPFEKNKEERCYRSGDYARELPDGNLEFIGRKDQQIKIDGFRVELSEIEAALNRFPGIQQVCVAARERQGRKQIIAYYTASRGQTIDLRDLKSFLKDLLPQSLLPAAYVQIAQFPVTENGKIDRALLPDPAGGEKHKIIPPLGSREADLLRIFQEIFHDDTFGLESGFFDLGGNSLQAARILARIRERFGLEIAFPNFYQCETIQELAAGLNESRTADNAAIRTQIPRCNSDRIPLSYSQERMWFLSRSEPDNPSLHSSFALLIEGELDNEILIRSLRELIARHAILRTVFLEEDGQPYQEVLPEIDLPLSTVDLSGKKDPLTELRRAITASNLKVFDIQAAPPFRLILYKLGPRKTALAVIIHHIITDGWSAEIFRSDLAEIYRQISNKAGFPKAAIHTYADFACWQKSEQFERRISPQLDYWKKKISDETAITQLPNDHARPLAQSSNADTVWLKIDGNLFRQLADYGSRHNTTLFPILLSAFCLTLSRHTHEQIIQIGSFFANRVLAEVENIMGPFVNGVVLKLDLSDSLNFNDLVKRAAATVMEAQANQEAPIEKVIDAVRVKRDRSQRTLFGIVFNFVNVPKSESGDGEIAFKYFDFETGTVTYDLNVEFNQDVDGLQFAFEYNTDIFNPATIQELAVHFKNMLQQAMQNPGKSIAEYSILTADEERELLAWSGGSAPYPRDTPIHELFERQVETTPRAAAVFHNGQTLTYAELNRKANQTAHWLIGMGLQPGNLAGLNLPKTESTIIAMLAVLKAGGAYLPLDPAYPHEHLLNIVMDAKPAIILTDSDTLIHLPPADVKVVRFDHAAQEIDAQADGNISAGVKAEDLAYCIYTSGSTGKPKGVMVEHRPLVNFTTSTMRQYEIHPGDRMLQFASLNFDTSAEEIFPTLCSGAMLALRSTDMLDSIPHFLQRCREWGLTILDLPTAFWQELVQYLEKSREKLPETLRMIIIGGERVSPAHLNTWHRLGFESIDLQNTYGLTECTCVVTRCRLTAQERAQYGQREAPIGKAIDNVRLYVLDERMRLAPKGAAGELYIGGDCLARGYLNRPDLTAERFLPDPIGGAGGRVYKTGDIVLWRPDGALEYLGRSDEQIKIRGFRIEPGEIETALMQFKGVSDAVVVKRSDPSKTEQLVAYLVADKGSSVDEALLRGHMNTRLPKYMQPAFYQILKELPLSPNRKIDKQALPEPDWAKGASRKTQKGPETPAEEKMLAIWQEMLGRQTIGVEDNFFEIGGHSLLAARMMAEVESRFGISVPLVALLENPTVRDLVKAISASGWNPSWKSLVRLKDGGNQPPIFLVHAIGGDVLSYRSLSAYLADLDRSIYGLRAQGVDGKTRPLESVEEMAALYLKEIREVQPHGPYYLGGYSFGGTVAYEMAQQLSAAGEKTALLAMFDTVVMENLPLELKPGKLVMALDRVERLGFIAGKWLRLSLPKKVDYFKKSIGVVSGRLKAFARRTKYVNPQEQADRERWLRKPPAFQKVETINQRALDAYVTKPYTGTVAYFKARQREWSEMVRPEPLWRRLALGGLSVYTCEGNHNSIMVEPYVRSLAAALRQALESGEQRQ
jgi:amino acid adenylation domain-containing protein